MSAYAGGESARRHPEEDTSAWDPDSLPAISGGDGLVLLGNDSMRARRRPGAILAFWALQAALAVLFAWPVADGMSSVWGAFPRGDAALWDPEAMPLFDTVLHEHALRSTAATLLVAVLLATAIAELVPLGALIASIAFVTRERRAPRLSDSVARGARSFSTFFALLAGASAAQLFVLVIAAWTTLAMTHGLADKLGEARAQQIAWLTGIVIAAFAAVIGVGHDLARAGAVRFRVRTVRALRLARNTLARGWLALFWAWGWRALAGWGPVVVGALVASKLGGRGGSALLALGVVHQLAALARVALRGSWLAAAVRAVDHAHRVVRR